RGQNAGARHRAAGSGRKSAQADIDREYSPAHVQVGHTRGSSQQWIASVFALFFREEEVSARCFSKRAAGAFAKPGEIDRSAKCESVVVVSERSAFRFAV